MTTNASRYQQMARDCVRKKDERGEQIIIALDGRKRERYGIYLRTCRHLSLAQSTQCSTPRRTYAGMYSPSFPFHHLCSILMP